MLHTVNCTLTNKLLNTQIWWEGNMAEGSTSCCFFVLTGFSDHSDHYLVLYSKMSFGLLTLKQEGKVCQNRVMLLFF